VRGSGWGDQVVRAWRWRPSTYQEVWIVAPLGFGVPGFCVSAIVEHSMTQALVYAVSVTLFGGLGQTWRLNRRSGDSPWVG
jgi:hypothetical protein